MAAYASLKKEFTEDEKAIISWDGSTNFSAERTFLTLAISRSVEVIFDCGIPWSSFHCFLTRDTRFERSAKQTNYAMLYFQSELMGTGHNAYCEELMKLHKCT